MAGLAFLVALALVADEAPSTVRVGSKKFTESVILGDIAVGLVREAAVPAIHLRELGGTQVLFHALESDELDVYPEYTGTISREILANHKIRDEASMRAALAGRGVGMSRPLGFNDTYAVGMREQVATRLGAMSLSDLRRHPDLRFGFSNEFMDRADGWPGMRDRYRLPQRDVRGLDHDLAYRAIASGEIEATDLYSTDAEIRQYSLRVLRDDLNFFPSYECVWLYRADLQARSPAAFSALERLLGKISSSEMVAMNARAKLDRVPEDRVAADFLAEKFGFEAAVSTETWVGRLFRRLGEHLVLVSISLAAAIVVSIPLGVIAARRPRLGPLILTTTGLIQTIPSLALLVFMIPWLGLGAKPAVAALFLYSLLPIVRNTATGLRDIPTSLRESAEALGLPARARLLRIELPLAARSILAGIKTAAVINVGTATLGALIGAGGFGQPILTGIRLYNVPMILYEGAIPAAVLALAVQAAFDLAERFVVAKGLRV
jgi:osmoprotectant transport system substrate-binding protein/osmoprotectant transport system permease protein